MSAEPTDLALEIAPNARHEILDLRSLFSIEHRDALAPYQHCLYWSAHTTAGFLDRGLANRLRPGKVPTYINLLRTMFPEGAGYEHDRLERREDLNPDQRAIEPKNADSHLTFIAGGLRSCVIHPNRPNEPVYFVELDGIMDGRPRRRKTRVIGFQSETIVKELQVSVPVSSHPIDSINLKDPQLGLQEQFSELLSRAGIKKGRLTLSLSKTERHAGLTVNEFETLLMQHDLAEVIRNPLRFAAEKYRNVLENPRAVPGKALGYAKYDFIRLLNTSFDSLGLRNSIFEKLIARTLAVPTSRFFRMKRSASLLVEQGPNGKTDFVEGTYQSPILVQWQQAPGNTRTLNVILTSLT